MDEHRDGERRDRGRMGQIKRLVERLQITAYKCETCISIIQASTVN